jgi:hypothetical protein
LPLLLLLVLLSLAPLEIGAFAVMPRAHLRLCLRRRCALGFRLVPRLQIRLFGGMLRFEFNALMGMTSRQIGRSTIRHRTRGSRRRRRRGGCWRSDNRRSRGPA